MRIALIGYGKMGHVVEQLALAAGDEVVVRIDKDCSVLESLEQLKQADVAIEFTAPTEAVRNIEACIALGLPIVCGTTGWYDALPRVREQVDGCKNGALFYAPNFSIGVNIFLRAGELLAKFRSEFPQYAVAIEETHHTAKLDAPSGTAIALAQPFLRGENAYSSWKLVPTNNPSILPITANRVENVPGIHTLRLDSVHDTIQLQHTAKSREGFAAGALAAARFLIGKRGVYSMKDLL
ncbi:MAG: 4-hydroxy-tetrahydrodipicolinate reductase [Bacteroides sp.]